jgi:2-polyprenyl-6-methoxyphenol hydroxylase-like FAD-dependent oxidoreductase
MRTENTEVLIVGAGPTGLLLACELARRAVSFRIIDKSPRPSQLSRGLGIHSRSLEIFEDLGLLCELVDRGFWLTGTSVFTDRTLSKRVPLDQTRSESDPFPSLLIIEQAQVEQVLTDELNRQGIEVERSCELKNFAQSEKEVSVTLSRDKLLERLKCRYLIGCDGPKSKVRQNLGIDFVGFTYPKVYTLAEVKMEWNLDPEMYRFIGADSDLVAIPLGEDRFRLTAWENSEQEGGDEEDSGHGSLRDAPTSEHIQALLDKLAPINSSWRQATDEADALSQATLVTSTLPPGLRASTPVSKTPITSAGN